MLTLYLFEDRIAKAQCSVVERWASLVGRFDKDGNLAILKNRRGSGGTIAGSHIGDFFADLCRLNTRSPLLLFCELQIGEPFERTKSPGVTMIKVVRVVELGKGDEPVGGYANAVVIAAKTGGHKPGELVIVDDAEPVTKIAYSED